MERGQLRPDQSGLRRFRQFVCVWAKILLF
jgi:hypothetical protein